jgi:hypothetical protein
MRCLSDAARAPDGASRGPPELLAEFGLDDAPPLLRRADPELRAESIAGDGSALPDRHGSADPAAERCPKSRSIGESACAALCGDDAGGKGRPRCCKLGEGRSEARVLPSPPTICCSSSNSVWFSPSLRIAAAAVPAAAPARSLVAAALLVDALSRRCDEARPSAGLVSAAARGWGDGNADLLFSALEAARAAANKHTPRPVASLQKQGGTERWVHSMLRTRWHSPTGAVRHPFGSACPAGRRDSAALWARRRQQRCDWPAWCSCECPLVLTLQHSGQAGLPLARRADADSRYR